MSFRTNFLPALSGACGAVWVVDSSDLAMAGWIGSVESQLDSSWSSDPHVILIIFGYFLVKTSHVVECGLYCFRFFFKFLLCFFDVFCFWILFLNAGWISKCRPWWCCATTAWACPMQELWMQQAWHLENDSFARRMQHLCNIMQSIQSIQTWQFCNSKRFCNTSKLVFITRLWSALVVWQCNAFVKTMEFCGFLTELCSAGTLIRDIRSKRSLQLNAEGLLFFDV